MAANVARLHNAGRTAYNRHDDYRASIMVGRILRVALPAVFAGSFGLQLAHADIYTWVDASGAINVSNLAPPEGTRVTRITRAAAPATAAREDAAREAARQAEVQALAERVRQLEDQFELASRPAPQAGYGAAPPPPVVQYVVDTTPAVQYAAVNMVSPANGGCYPTWAGCGLWWGYPASVVVLHSPSFRPFHSVRPGHNFAGHRPQMHAPWGFRKR
jgi:hypothetical protein